MPKTCCAVNCRTGYKHELPPGEQGISLFGFPLENPALLKEWMKRLCRKDFCPNKNTRLCSLHFLDTDIELERRDSNKQRVKSLTSDLQKRRLKAGAIPTVFNIPAYYNVPVPDDRESSLKTSAESRRAEDESRHQDLVESFLCSDKVFTVADIYKHYDEVQVPTF